MKDLNESAVVPETSGKLKAGETAAVTLAHATECWLRLSGCLLLHNLLPIEGKGEREY